MNKKSISVISVMGAFYMLATPAMAEVASARILNHYSDYGVVEHNNALRSVSVSIGNDAFGYADEYTDNESGLQYLQVRYYNPIMMRFTQMDTYPLLNRYAYGNDNPIMNTDPSGHMPVPGQAPGKMLVSSLDEELTEQATPQQEVDNTLTEIYSIMQEVTALNPELAVVDVVETATIDGFLDWDKVLDDIDFARSRINIADLNPVDDGEQLIKDTDDINDKRSVEDNDNRVKDESSDSKSKQQNHSLKNEEADYENEKISQRPSQHGGLQSNVDFDELEKTALANQRDAEELWREFGQPAEVSPPQASTSSSPLNVQKLTTSNSITTTWQREDTGDMLHIDVDRTDPNELSEGESSKLRLPALLRNFFS